MRVAVTVVLRLGAGCRPGRLGEWKMHHLQCDKLQLVVGCWYSRCGDGQVRPSRGRGNTVGACSLSPRFRQYSCSAAGQLEQARVG